MSSYYPSFNYMGLNSLKDKHLIVTHFDADSGESDTFLGMDPVYTGRFDGSRRFDYGAKYNNVAVIKITAIKANGCDFSMSDVRDFLRWTTGSRNSSFLDLLIGDEVKFSFLGRVTNAYQYKMDARTIGMVIEFTSISPFAYSKQQNRSINVTQGIAIDGSGVAYSTTKAIALSADDNGVLHNSSEYGHAFTLAGGGVVDANGKVAIEIENETDDLYGYVYVDTTITNFAGDFITIKNTTLNEETVITDLSDNEQITLSAGQFIVSNKANKIFGNAFNFVWPRLAPGTNEFVIDSGGEVRLEFTYRYPVKVGDCAIDIYLSTCSMCGCEYSDTPALGTVSWNDIVDTPNTIEGYGIINAYNMVEVDSKLENIETSVDEQELNDMLDEELD